MFYGTTKAVNVQQIDGLVREDEVDKAVIDLLVSQELRNCVNGRMLMALRNYGSRWMALRSCDGGSRLTALRNSDSGSILSALTTVIVIAG